MLRSCFLRCLPAQTKHSAEREMDSWRCWQYSANLIDRVDWNNVASKRIPDGVSAWIDSVASV